MEHGSHDRWWVIPGLRGVGKTTILAQTYLQAVEHGQDINLLYVSLDEAAIAGANLADVLSVYQEEILGDYFENLKKPTLILVDEAQADPAWAQVLKTVYDRSRRVFMLCSGSSALHLQMDANVAGRRARIETMYPLSFAEYQLLANQRKIDERLREQLMQALYDSASAGEVYHCLKTLKADVNRCYAASKPLDLPFYLEYGTMPLAIQRQRALLQKDIQTTIDKVVNVDLRSWRDFSAATLSAVPRLLSLLASSGDVVGLPKLSQALGISRQQLISIMDVLVKAGILIKIPAYGGSPFSSSRRPAKYTFTSAAIRSSYLGFTGEPTADGRRRGQLLEDVAGLHYQREFVGVGKGSLAHHYSKAGGHCDFILQIGNHKRIALEFGLGNKGVGQTAATMKKVKCQYGLVFSKSELRLDGQQDIVSIPLDYFLLI